MRSTVWTGLSLCILALAVPAGASTFLALSQEELVEQADAKSDQVKLNASQKLRATAIVTNGILRSLDITPAQARHLQPGQLQDITVKLPDSLAG